ncbi:MAG: EVE domain-containing protein [Thermoplasmatota archaeon]
MKTEPNVFSIQDLAKVKKTRWDGVRNYGARNHLRTMRAGDGVLVYHSNADPSAVVGTARVAIEAYPDPTAFDKRSEAFDPKSSREAPIWFSPDLAFDSIFGVPVSLEQIRGTPGLAQMTLLRQSRLSVQQVTAAEWKLVLALGKG